MITSALISVVMAVYNGAVSLPATLDSILTQEGVDLEFIVVNDGSTDNTAQILRDYADRDKRLRVFEQDNRGLTRSLIRGCTEARGEFIARQDAGDVSLPGRLRKERNYLIDHTAVRLVSCGTRFVGPDGEIIHEVFQAEAEAEAGLQRLSLDTIQGPSHHGSAMFRRNDYEAVGGYRHQFQVAQDLDLWLRLTELGIHSAVQEILYQALMSPSSISSRLRVPQLANAELILEGARRRREGQGEEKILDQATENACVKSMSGKQVNDAAFYYFLGCCLAGKNPVKARKYFMSALKANPLCFKAALRLLRIEIF